MTARDLKDLGLYMGPSLLFPEKSINLLIKNLMSNEEILIVANCNSGSTPGALAVTNVRVMFGSVVGFSSKFTDFDIKKISSVTYLREYSSKLRIQSSADILEIGALGKDAGQIIVNKIKELQSGGESVPQQGNGLNDLEKLADLKAKGIITEEEFNLKKKQILGL